MTKSGKEERVTVRGTTTAISVTAIRTLVDHRCGLHLGPDWTFEGGLSDSTLVRVLPDYAIEAFQLHALYQPSDFVPEKTRIFIEVFGDAMRRQTAVADR